ncbi:MAG: cupin domain-containing protein [Sphaerochaetaceae bacterium]
MIRKREEMPINILEHMRGGDKEVEQLEIMPKGTVRHCRMFSKMTLAFGSSIGRHQHVGETEYYWILSGVGIVTENDGEHTVVPGDVVITGNGAEHAIRNEEKEDLVFLALIILD